MTSCELVIGWGLMKNTTFILLQASIKNNEEEIKMESMKRFAFLVQDNTGTFIICRQWGSERKEAQNRIHLNQYHALVSDLSVIREFADKELKEINEDLTINKNHHMIKEYIDDLNQLKQLASRDDISLNIEEKMAYIRKALEMGATIDLSFHDFRDKESAEKAAKELSESIQVPYLQKSNQGTNWFKIRTDDYTVDTNIFFEATEKKEAM